MMSPFSAACFALTAYNVVVLVCLMALDIRPDPHWYYPAWGGGALLIFGATWATVRDRQ